MRRSAQHDQDRVPPGPDHGGFGGADGARAAEASIHSDATELRDDPALRLATDRAGTSAGQGRAPALAADAVAAGGGVVGEGGRRGAARGVAAAGGVAAEGDGRVAASEVVIDIDSLPVEVHGEQPGSAWNGYYHRRVYHPIVAAAGETGILDLR